MVICHSYVGVLEAIVDEMHTRSLNNVFVLFDMSALVFTQFYPHFFDVETSLSDKNHG